MLHILCLVTFKHSVGSINFVLLLFSLYEYRICTFQVGIHKIMLNYEILICIFKF